MWLHPKSSFNITWWGNIVNSVDLITHGDHGARIEAGNAGDAVETAARAVKRSLAWESGLARDWGVPTGACARGKLTLEYGDSDAFCDRN